MASPGSSRMKRNVRSETPTSVGMAPSSRCACLLDRIARDRVLVARDEVQVAIVGEIAIDVEVRVGTTPVEARRHVEVRLEPPVDPLRELEGLDLHVDADLGELRLHELC